MYKIRRWLKKLHMLAEALDLARGYWELFPKWAKIVIASAVSGLSTFLLTFFLWAKQIIFASVPLQIGIGVLIAILVAVTLEWLSLQRAKRRFVEREQRILESIDDQEMKDWLTHKLSAVPLGVVALFCFGSIIHSYATRNDVDVIIVLDDASKRIIKQRVKKIQEIRREFRDIFSHSLHCQWFKVSEEYKLRQFLIKANSHEQLFSKVQ